MQKLSEIHTTMRFSKSGFPVAVFLCMAGSFNVQGGGAAPFDGARLREIETTIRQAVEEGATPGAILRIERAERVFQVEIGRRAIDPNEEALTPDTIFDVASLTKVVATAPAIMVLVERGDVELDASVKRYIPEFSRDGRDDVTIRHLLSHTSGLRAGLGYPTWRGRDTAIELICRETLRADPGKEFVYSDLNFILLGEVVTRAGGVPLEEFVRKELFEPLGMADTGFHPPQSKIDRIAPTQRARDGMLRGVVHDPTARAMGGVAGHAGLFSTVDDLARYCRMILARGELDGVRVLSSDAVDEMTAVQTAAVTGVRRGLGWDIDSRFSRPRGKFPLGSFGHTGWTGPCLWIDPFSGTYWLFLSNRVHPDGSGDVIPLQRRLAGLVCDAIADFDFDNVPGALPSLSTPPD